MLSGCQSCQVIRVVRLSRFSCYQSCWVIIVVELSWINHELISKFFVKNYISLFFQCPVLKYNIDTKAIKVPYTISDDHAIVTDALNTLMIT